MERGHNWLLVFYNEKSAREYFERRCKNNNSIVFSTLYSIKLENTIHYEILIFFYDLMNRSQISTTVQIMIKELGTTYSIYKRCTNGCTMIEKFGTEPKESDNTIQATIDTFRDGEGDTESIFYKRYPTFFNNIMQDARTPIPFTGSQQSSQHESQIPSNEIASVTSAPNDKNFFIHGGTEKSRMEYIENLTKGSSTYFKKSDKFWDGYKNQRYVIISEASNVSIKRIVDRINVWTMQDIFEAETRHRKFMVDPKMYILVISASWSLDALKLDDDGKEVFSRFKTIDLTDYERDENSITEEIIPQKPIKRKNVKSKEKKETKPKKKGTIDDLPIIPLSTLQSSAPIKATSTDNLKISSLKSATPSKKEDEKNEKKEPIEKDITTIQSTIKKKDDTKRGEERKKHHKHHHEKKPKTPEDSEKKRKRHEEGKKHHHHHRRHVDITVTREVTQKNEINDEKKKVN